jgi:hypothetical protein
MNIRNPLSNYLLFSQELMGRYRAQDPTKSTSDLMKIIGKEWNELNDEQKAVYTTMSVALRADYKQRMVAYKATPHSGEFGGVAPAATASATSSPAKPTPTKIAKPTKVATPVVVAAAAPAVETEKKKKRKHHEKDADQPASVAVAESETEKKKKVLTLNDTIS